ncbi:hypothetical protein CC86DRAFT_374291 [Ophiobolus disseminans]|uniref:Uncharacterized protein n=1 Tax=Ophiobolus disseminans TaxID=1469910 RepID=A0A6A6ZIS9_9PLEO|nr:hypothetical protein CC86DRAFT_374291 [Ophiobolus disseminans]
MTLRPIFNPFSKRPATATTKSPLIPVHSLVRDQFTISTWLIFGALIQGIAHLLLPYRNIVVVLPVILILAYKLANTALVLSGVLPNPHMADVLQYRTALAYPNEKGTYEKSGDSSVCAILLGVISNHPLGMLGPGYKEVGDRFDEMVSEMSADASTHGFLGASNWVNASYRTTSNEFASILYFENEEYLHAYAHGSIHTKAMQWWHETAAQHKHVGIMHEVFTCPKNSWEGVYLNYHPTGLGSTTKEVTGLDGKRAWMSPLVKGKGKMAYSKGRMGRTYGEKEWVAYEDVLAKETDV